jgi:DNA-binding PucR family transcriptional regulator
VAEPRKAVVGSPPGRLTLASLVNDAGFGLLDAVAAPAGLDVPVVKAVIAGGIHDMHVDAGDLVLVLAMSPTDPSLKEVLERAGRAGAAGVVLRSADRIPDSACELAEEANVALIRVPPEIRWDRLYAFVETAIASPPADPYGPGDVPLGDLFALANAVAALVGGPVTIEDVHSHLLAYSSGDQPLDEPRRQSILMRRTPESWMQKFRAAGVFHKFWTSDEVVRIEEFASEGLRPRLAVAIRAGGEVLGSIWVAEGETPLGRASAAALAEASRMAALHMLRRRAVEDVERQARGELLRSLFDGVGDPDIITGRLGIDAAVPIAVIAIEPAPGHEGRLPPVREALVDMAGLSAEAFHRHACCVMTGPAIHLLVPILEGRDDLRPLAREVVDRAEAALGIPLLAGIGATVDNLGDAPASRRQADQAVAVLRKDPHGRRVAHIADVRSETVLTELRSLVADWIPPHAKELQALATYDDGHGTGYLDTLRAWLDNFGDVARAAAAVNVHPNTFRYRLRRLGELSGIDLANADERLALELQLRLWPPPHAH